MAAARPFAPRAVTAVLAVSALTLSGASVLSPAEAAPSSAGRLPYENPQLPVRQRVNDLLGRMTLAEKVGQMTQAERASVDADRSLIKTWKLGSLLSGGGSTPEHNTPKAWADMVDAYQRPAMKTRLHIPLIYGIDSVHGHGNLYGSTLFPHNIGLGATRDPALVRDAEHVTASETRATGIPWVFAPCVCVARDTRWGRTYESFGEDPALVEDMETSIDGFQGTRVRELSHADRVLATAKHFAGDGDTRYGSGRNSAGANSSDYPIDQGISITSHQAFQRVALSPYVPAVRQHHVGSIMPSYSSVDWTEDGVGNPIKMHANRSLIQGWLKNKVGFNGFVISDYHGLDQIPGDRESDVRTWVKAGGDMAMEPDDYQDFETTLISEVRSGQVSRARIDDAVRRILTKKFQLGLFEHPFANRSNLKAIGSAQHRAVARRAAAESQVLLKNAGGALPLRRNAKIYVAGRTANNLGNQAGGWTITWQGQSGTFTRGTTILQGMRQVAPQAHITYSKNASAPTAGSDVGVVVVGETPYSEGYGDVNGPRWAFDPSDNGQPRENKQMRLHARDRHVISSVCSRIATCVVLVVSGRPQVVTDQLGQMDALVASELPGTEGEGVADVLFGRRPFTGQLSQTWPRSPEQEPINVGDADYAPLFPFGWGLHTGSSAHWTVGNQPQRLTVLRELVQRFVLGSGGTGVPARAADLIARSDAEHLRGHDGQATRLLLRVLG
jgi:beta-glucosidase